jgi:hypothetical protein
MKQWIAFLALSILVGTAWADAACYPVGTTLTLRGIAVRETVETSDGSDKSVSMLAMDPPLCVVDRRYSQDAQGRIAVPRVELVGPAPASGASLAVTGTLSTRNAPEYFLIPTAMWVTPPARHP